MPRNGHLTRDHIVKSAAKLFYGEGIRAVSVDAVADAAGITKKTLYYHFDSKDDLIAAYLESQDQPTIDLYRKWFEETEGPVEEKVRGLFAKFASVASKPKWRGCGFMRTTAELASTPGHPAVKAGAAHKKKFEHWLTQVLRADAIKEPEDAARKLLVLLDGAASAMLVHRDCDYALKAGEVAVSIVQRTG